MQLVLRKLKRAGGFGRWPGYEVARDRHGVWAFSPAGTVYWGHSSSGSIVEWEVGRPPAASEGAAELWLLPPDAWWVAKWTEVRGVRGIHVDVSTPVELSGGEWCFADLELDPYWHADDEVGVGDEPEFLAACRQGLISSEEALVARRTVDEVVALLRSRVEPFGEVGWARLAESAAANHAPLWIEPVHVEAGGCVTA